MKSKKFDFRTAYIDLLINLLTGTVVLFILTTILIAPSTKNNEGIKKNADYIISLEWPNDVDCDMDLWVRDAQNNIVSYRIPEAGLMYFERDDMGKRRSVYEVDGKQVVIDPDNKEFVTLRGSFAGEYILNVHVYSCINTITRMAMTNGMAIDIPVSIEVTRINPSFIVVKHVEMKMNSVWQEKTAIRFVMDDNKNIVRFKEGDIKIRIGNTQ